MHRIMCISLCAHDTVRTKEGRVFIQSARTFAQFVRSQRVLSGMTQQELGSRTGMSRRWVQELESGRLIPSLEATLNVASTLGYEIHLEPKQTASHLDAMFEGLS